MHKLFDKIFANRVQEVFDNHQEAYNPDDWKKLRAKMSKNRKGVVIIMPFVAKAASVALFVGLSVFVANKNAENKFADKTIDKSLENLTVNDSVYDNVIDNHEFKYLANIVENNNNEKIAENKIIDNQVDSAEDEILIAQTDNSFIRFDSLNRFANVKDELQKYHKEIQDMDTFTRKSNKPILLQYDDEFEIAENKTREKRVGFGVEVASVSNYSFEGTGNGVNVGGGISAAYRVTKNISFTTGALIAKQSVNYNNNSNHEALYADYSPVGENSLAIIDGDQPKAEVSFVAIDIPLNVQFKHKRISFTTGLSSLFYVQEKYSYSFNTVVTNTSYNKQTLSYDINYTSETVNNEEKTDSFDRFDFARLLNLSVGYDIPLNKGNLVVEPYLKYPIGSVSFKEISMGSGGFALHYIF